MMTNMLTYPKIEDRVGPSKITKRSMQYSSCVVLICWLWIGHLLVAVPSVGDHLKERTVVATASGRALKDAIFLLGTQLECQISYEDPPYYHASTIQFLTPDGPQVPAQHSIFFTYNPLLPRAEIIQNLLDQYQKVDDTAVFKLVRSENRGQEVFNVMPVQVKTRDGLKIGWKSSLDKEISLSLTGTYYEIATRIAELASQEDQKLRTVRGYARGP